MTDYIKELECLKRKAEKNNKPLYNWYLCMLFSVLTFGIFFVGVFVERIKRLNKFIEIRAEYYKLVTAFTKDLYVSGVVKGKISERALYNLNLQTQSFLSYNPIIPPTKTLILFVLTGGLYIFYYIYLMNKAWITLQYYEANYNKLLTVVWLEAEVTEEPIVFRVTNEPKHRFLVKVLFSVLTCGLYLIYWDYTAHVEPDTLFVRFADTAEATEKVIGKHTQN